MFSRTRVSILTLYRREEGRNEVAVKRKRKENEKLIHISKFTMFAHLPVVGDDVSSSSTS
jgi:hypothetical protein